MRDPNGIEGQPAAVPADVLDELAAAVAGVLPTLIARIPPEPAAQLGRLGVPVAPGERPIAPGRGGLPFVAPVPVARPQPAPGPYFVSGPPALPAQTGGPSASSTLSALRGLGQLLPERVLGALELAVDEVELPGVPGGLTTSLPIAETQQWFVTAVVGGGGGTEEAVRLLDQLRPGVSALAHALVQALATHPAITPHLAVETSAPPHSERDGAAAESAIAARHGAAYLALAVATARALLREVAVPTPPSRAATVVGLGLGTAARIPHPERLADFSWIRIGGRGTRTVR
ncbi:hypothetical protein UG55_103867 [Frankia sp. EI5c]|uniref:hypothetical protein n=1 Tax=Frankia sp. EI5c TaxID=683316 RepID=UPI0007C31ECB|nr:hypothetical protein [Frankia sp. EI5c]OAA23370.1 hypothetical protein UG55_103867 [Frankia sp. EI5c]